MISNKEPKPWLYLSPVIFIIAIVPLIVHLKIVPLSSDVLQFWTGENANFDFFSYWKMVFFLISVSVLALYFIVKFLPEQKIKPTILYIPMAIYAAGILVSTLLSEHKGLALFGFPDRYEGMFVLLGYLLLTFMVINIITKELDIKIIIGALIVGSVIIGLIGLSQYFGHDLFQTSFGKQIMLPKKYSYLADKVANVINQQSIYGTLYHYDYMGSYMAMLVPISISLLIWIKNFYLKILAFLFAILMVINLIGSTSRAGLTGTIMGLIFFALITYKHSLRNWKKVIALLAVVAAMILALNQYSGGQVELRIKSLAADAKNLVLGNKTAAPQMPVKDFSITGNNVSMTIDNVTLKFGLDKDQLDFKDANNKLIPLQQDPKTGHIYLQDQRFNSFAITLGSMNKQTVLQVVKDQLLFNFAFTDKGIELLNQAGYVVPLKPVERWGFEGKESLGSARGYIWSRSIPLLKNTIITGYGPDNFAVYFPQYDFLGKAQVYRDPWQLVDKPHDLYLQIALDTGIVSLIGFLSLVLIYFIKGSKVYLNSNYESFTEIIGVGIQSAIFGYLVAGFFNDSVVSVAPVFWVLLGLGISINLRLKSDKAAMLQ